MLGLYTGARKQAILSLQWMENTGGGWVDLDNEIIYWRGRGRQTKKRRPKGTPIPKRLLRFLQYAHRRSRQYVIEIDGKPIMNVKRSFVTACRKAMLEDVMPHTLCHTCITWLLQAGVNLWDVAEFTGRSEEIIRRVYGHHAPDYLDAARRALD